LITWTSAVEISSICMQDVCLKTKEKIRRILIIDERSGKRTIVSSGTGTVVRGDGLILTAAHVLMKEVKQPYLGNIMVSHPLLGETEYEMVLKTALSFALPKTVGDYLQSIELDLMLIKPKVFLGHEITFMPLAAEIATLGEDVIIAGYPDDTDLPFKIFERLNFNNPELAAVRSDIQRMEGFFRLPLMKRAMIGLVSNISFKDIRVNITGLSLPESINFEGAVYWLDNHLTYGGSGGPVVNKDGSLVGVVTEKAFTADKEKMIRKSVPSGTGMAFSHQMITWLLPYV